MSRLYNHHSQQRGFLGFPLPMAKGVRLIVLLWGALLFLFTLLGSSSLLHSPIQPLYLITAVIAPSLLFLLFTLLRAKSLLGMLFIWLTNLLPNRFKPSVIDEEYLSPEQIRRLLKFIAHFSWSLIFLGFLVGFLLHFSIRHYDFILSSTLFPNSPKFYQSVVGAIDLLPNLLGISPITPELIESTLTGALTEEENAKWARWVLLILLFYGFIPRVLFMLMAAHSFKRVMKHQPRTPRPQIKKGERFLDKAAKTPVIEREKKSFFTGRGEAAIALDYAFDDLPSGVKSIQDRTAFTAFEAKLKAAPLEKLSLYIDPNLTPDRGLLRRIMRLLNLSHQGEIILYGEGTEERKREWQRRLGPLLSKNETVIELNPLNRRVETLSQNQPTSPNLEEKHETV